MNDNNGLVPGEGIGGWSADSGAGLHYACGLVGLIVTLAAIAATYSLLVAVTSSLSLLSTTALVILGVVAWLIVWLLVDRSVVAIKRSTLRR
jgi:hypothetical protein